MASSTGQLDRSATIVTVYRQHIGPVREIGDGAETFCLALGAEHACRTVESLEEGVRPGTELGDHLQSERGRHGGYCHPFTVQQIPVAVQGNAVQGEAEQDGAVTVQPERPYAGCGVMVCPDGQAGMNACDLLAKLEAELDGVNQVAGRSVILAIDDAVRGLWHVFLPYRWSSLLSDTVRHGRTACKPFIRRDVKVDRKTGYLKGDQL